MQLFVLVTAAKGNLSRVLAIGIGNAERWKENHTDIEYRLCGALCGCFRRNGRLKQSAISK